MTTSQGHAKRVVPYTSECCAPTVGKAHFCGNGTMLRGNLSSKCLICEKIVPAVVMKSFDNPPRVYMLKFCPEHGQTDSPISSDASYYYVKKEGEASCCGPSGCGPTPLGENAKQEFQLHTCTLVVEIVKECNISCNTCYANSPHAPRKIAHDILSLSELKNQVNAVLDKQGKIDILQLSGGEPTLHPELMQIMDWLSEEERVLDVLLNTNGIILSNPMFTKELAKRAPKGRFGVYLQFDGAEKDGQKELRVGDYRTLRERVIRECKKYNIPISLVMTVTHDNKFYCHSAITRALSDEHIKWVVFQPEFIVGRNDRNKLLEEPISVADIIHNVATGSVMDKGSWMPLPCSDPNCGTVGFLVRKDGVWYPVSRFVDMSAFVSPLIANRMNFDIDDSLAKCGCDNYDLGSYLTSLGIAKEDIKMIFIKPFMDARSWDEGRIAACCTHVLTPEGKVGSFCRYYGSK